MHRHVAAAITLLLAVCLPHGVIWAAALASTFPLQLEMRVQFEPTAFASGGRNYLAYELYLANFGPAALALRRIEVLDAGTGAREPVAAFESGQLDTLLQPVGSQASPKGSIDRRELAAGGSVVVFMWVALEHGAHVPNSLRHRVITAESAAEGAVIGTHHTELHVLGPPLEGANWLASDGPSNDQDNHHRRGIFVFDGRPLISRRYAIDWMQSENGATFSGDALDKRSYYSYGKAVLAVADGRVVTAKDGLPENVPGHNEGFHPAVPITPETVGGNTITLDLGGGQFAHYCHLQPGSLSVKTGDRVRRGQILARIGDSGDARELHLHFQVSTSSMLMAGEGVPYLIDAYRVTAATAGTAEARTRELPLKDTLVAFREGHEGPTDVVRATPGTVEGKTR
jgi:Peptidase family M23